MQNINFNEVKKAIDLLGSLNNIDTEIFLTEYLEYSKQYLTSTQLEFVLNKLMCSGLTNQYLLTSSVLPLYRRSGLRTAKPLTNQYLLTSSVLPSIGLNNIYTTVTGQPITPVITQEKLVEISNPMDFHYVLGMGILYVSVNEDFYRKTGIIKEIFPYSLSIIDDKGILEFISKDNVKYLLTKTIVV